MKLKLGLAAALIAIGATSIAAANEDVIKMRRLLMGANGQAAKISVAMIKGDMPFDPVVAAAVVSTIAHDAEVFPSLFPAGSETGDTKAGPAIWSDAAGFKAASDAAATAAKAAAAAAAQGKDAFSAAFGAVGAACGACHEKYRAS